MNILSIESSCDETACAIVRDGHDILSNVVVSQIDIFKAYGGVIPEVAARSHLEAILPVIHKALDDAFPNLPEGQQWNQIDAISVTHTPGLLGSLLIGTLTARTLAILHSKPFYPIHHLKSHIYATWLNQHEKADNTIFSEDRSFRGCAQAAAVRPLGRGSEATPKRGIPVKTGDADAASERTVLNKMHRMPAFPLLALVISGGHTQIIHMKKHNDFEIIGTTRDDAVGECFDKVAKILGLPYPGGPSISNAALGHITLQSGESFETTPGDRHKYHFPHPKVQDLDFSFSGLKTAVLRTVQKELGVPISFPSHDLPEKILSLPDPARFIADFSASFEQTAISILLEKLQKALTLHPSTTSVILSGGVSANTLLRKEARYLFAGVCGGYDRAQARETRDDGFERRDPANSVSCFFPSKSFSGDNAAMVASATYYEIKSGVSPTDPYSLTLLPRSPIS